MYQKKKDPGFEYNSFFPEKENKPIVRQIILSAVSGCTHSNLGADSVYNESTQCISCELTLV